MLWTIEKVTAFAQEALEDREVNPLLYEWYLLMQRGCENFNLFRSDYGEWRRRLEEDGGQHYHAHMARKELTARYAWAVPCRMALHAIAKYSPLIEMGAGTGYWASLLTKLHKVDILCYDKCPPPREDNNWHTLNVQHYPVKGGSPKVIRKHPERTLFLCWPPYGTKMAHECLCNYKGDTLLYVGENEGCTGCDKFNQMLDEEWKVVEEVTLPQFDGIHDYLMVLRRK